MGKTAVSRFQVALATRSAGKIRELIPMLSAAHLSPVTLETLGVAESPAEGAVEAFETFEDNALAKARYFASLLPGLAVLADDSGLAVDALHGAPGVRSKRWSASGLTGQANDDANNAKLLAALADPALARTARYVCVAAIVWTADEWAEDAPQELHARGETVGRIAYAPRGVNGFGYDPYFESDELAMTFGEATTAAKERISHRGRAVRAALDAYTRARFTEKKDARNR
ncbi:MAG: non-canonical purine NTP pyrophosphatase [Gemmatimonadota bacterium]|nr:non-canonical purine NTP pyrophosphatase [Gemmatimonadota bacterium]